MNESSSPFVLGRPIKDPSEFHGRERELRELFESIANMQPVALVGEHRCGNTSLLYQMLHDDVQERFLDMDERARMLFAFVNSQLAGESPEALFRRIARAIRRADDASGADFEAQIDAFWIEDYLEDLADRGRRLVLLLDEFEVLASFEASFWEWFRGLITEYDVSIVVATRVELGGFRDEWGSGSPFFNMFRTIYVGSFTSAETEGFLRAAADASGYDFPALAEQIGELAGRFPYYMQVACELFHERASVDGEFGTPAQVESVAAEFRARTEAHFEDIWSKLPEQEREALRWLAVDQRPVQPSESMAFDQALPNLTRRGYVVAGRIFSAPFRDYIQRHMLRIEISSESGVVRIEKRSVDLPPKEFALLRLLLENEGEAVAKETIAEEVWPEYGQHAMGGVTDAMIQKTISRLRKEIDSSDTGFQHIDSIRGLGYRFQNSTVHAFYHQRAGEEEPAPPLRLITPGHS